MRENTSYLLEMHGYAGQCSIGCGWNSASRSPRRGCRTWLGSMPTPSPIRKPQLRQRSTKAGAVQPVGGAKVAIVGPEWHSPAKGCRPWMRSRYDGHTDDAILFWVDKFPVQTKALRREEDFFDDRQFGFNHRLHSPSPYLVNSRMHFLGETAGKGRPT
jgi:hypothetical protein